MLNGSLDLIMKLQKVAQNLSIHYLIEIQHVTRPAADSKIIKIPNETRSKKKFDDEKKININDVAKKKSF